MSAIGMMDGAFFVGRKEIVDWVNDTLNVNISKIEETAFGGIACQLLDIMYPGQVPLHKVNWAAKSEVDYVANYKVLQTAMTKVHIDKFVDVDRLVKGRYQDNLEFMQWFKRFFEMNVQNLGDYDPVAQRLKGKGGQQYNNSNSKGTSSAKVNVVRTNPAISTTVAKAKSEKSAATSKVIATKENRSNMAAVPEKTITKSTSIPKSPLKKVSSNVSANNSSAISAQAAEEISALKLANEQAAKDLAEFQLEFDGLAKERDFYFDKLRDIEMMLQDLEDAGNGNELTAKIFKILYATADGFEQEDNLPKENQDKDITETEIETVEEPILVEDITVE